VSHTNGAKAAAVAADAGKPATSANMSLVNLSPRQRRWPQGNLGRVRGLTLFGPGGCRGSNWATGAHPGHLIFSGGKDNVGEIREKGSDADDANTSDPQHQTGGRTDHQCADPRWLYRLDRRGESRRRSGADRWVWLTCIPISTRRSGAWADTDTRPDRA